MLNRNIVAQVILNTNNATLYKCLYLSDLNPNFEYFTKHMLRFRKIRPYIYTFNSEDYFIRRLSQTALNPKTGLNYEHMDIFKDLTLNDIKYISRIYPEFFKRSEIIDEIINYLEWDLGTGSIFDSNKNDKILKYIIKNIELFTTKTFISPFGFHSTNAANILNNILNAISIYDPRVNKNKLIKWIIEYDKYTPPPPILQTNIHIYIILNLNSKITKKYYIDQYVNSINRVNLLNCYFHDKFHGNYYDNEIDIFFKKNQKVNKKNFTNNIKWIQTEFRVSDIDILKWVANNRYSLYYLPLQNRHIAYFYLKDILLKSNSEIIKIAIREKQFPFAVFVLFGEKLDFIDTWKNIFVKVIGNDKTFHSLCVLLPYIHYIFLTYVILHRNENYKSWIPVFKRMNFCYFLFHKTIFGRIRYNIPTNVSSLNVFFEYAFKVEVDAINDIVKDFKYLCNNPKRYIQMVENTFPIVVGIVIGSFVGRFIYKKYFSN